ncbi:hypothetical protein U9M48_000952 [Paspalum notatum var. saurae]|uniref:AAA+ ATPase domain-containing protein n=1 Tax=Paspalum notatum var. saurae TaxID=547442 RepID=A0AAQ3PMG5_PASNO
MKKSNLLNQQISSSEIPNKDTNNERSSSEVTAKDTKKESSSRQEQIDDWYRKIERKVFGRDKDLERICKMFRKRSDPYGKASCSSSKPYSVFGIHGIAGSGKSTLANYICDHEKKAEDKHFDPIMFIHVSVTFRVEKIFCDMLWDITNMQSDIKDIESLGKKLMEKLKGRRFLLVLDDLWIKGENQKEREILLHALSAGENGSIILVTAQTEDAASALGAQEQIPIQDLEEVQYLKLFMHHALQGAVDDDGTFQRIGRSIAKKLHRSPIAAVAVGRRLQAEKSVTFWETTVNLDVLNETMGVLWWSYQQLGVDTRRCFQYCSTFPKGYMLERDELVRMWIAQGFVNAGSNEIEELEDVGMRYFQELLKFSFLQKRIYHSEAYTIHDLLHELAERVAGSDFSRIVDSSVLPAKDIRSVRHLFIGSKDAAQGAQTTEKNLDLGNLRTLIIVETYTKGMTNLIRLRHIQGQLVSPNVGNITSLQTMDDFFHVTKEQGYELKQLKHLNKLRGCLKIAVHENAGSKEEALEADLPSKKRVTDLELWFHGRIKNNPDIEAEVLEGLCPPKDLQVLTIEGYKGSRYPSWMLSGQQHPDAPKYLRRLKLRDCRCPLASFPEDSELFMHLHELFISGCEWDSLPENMERLVSLQSLSIVGCGHSKSTMVLGPTLPRSLRKIWVYRSNLVIENMEHLVTLESLDIHDCDSMEVLPTLPRSLKKIYISGEVLGRTCQEEGHENWQKIQHIGRRRISSGEKETFVRWEFQAP